MLNSEFTEFYRRWKEKAEGYRDENLKDVFDKFFTLYVLYNRLYAEVTFQMAKDNLINLTDRNNFPDKKAAKIIRFNS